MRAGLLEGDDAPTIGVYRRQPASHAPQPPLPEVASPGTCCRVFECLVRSGAKRDLAVRTVLDQAISDGIGLVAYDALERLLDAAADLIDACNRRGPPRGA